MGRTLDPFDLRDLLARNLDHPRFAEVGRALPHLRQLHARLPHLLLHLGRGRQRARRTGRPSAGAAGTRASRSTTRTSTAAPSGARRGPATASGSRTSSAPGSTSSAPRGASAAAGASPGARSGSTSPRSSPRSVPPTGRSIMQTLDEIVAESPVFAGLEPAQLAADRRLRAERRLRRGRAALPRGRRGRHLLPRAPRPRRARRRTSRPRRRHDRDDRAGRGASAGRGSSSRTAGTSTLARSRTRGVVAFDGACLRGKCDDDHALGYELMRRFAQVMIDRLQHTRTLPPGRVWRRLRQLRPPPRGAMTPVPYRVVSRTQETADTWTLQLEPLGAPIVPAPGQFDMLYAFGVGEVPISTSGAPEPGGELVAHDPRRRPGHAGALRGRARRRDRRARPVRHDLAARGGGAAATS